MAKHVTSTLFLILFILLTTIPSSHSNDHTDLEALLAFKKYIHDDPLHALSSWNETMHFCRWNGVSCSKRHPSRVVSLSLQSQGLVGSLSPHIGNLSFLRIINLQNNTFSGPIPQEMGRLRRLQVIKFSNNSFGGGIPTNLSQCTNLYYLNLVDNQLTGVIVPEIASLDYPAIPRKLHRSIPTVDRFLPLKGKIPESPLNFKDCSGALPASLSNSSLIELIEVSENSFTGNMIDLTRFPALKVLLVASNRFNGDIGTILSSLTNCTNLETLELNGNHFTGSLPDSIGNLSDHLSSLRLDKNQLSGSIPSSPIPSSIGKLHNLQLITIHKNRLINEMPFSLGNLTLLNILSLALNNLSGSIPQSLGNCTNLLELGLAYNNLSGLIPPEIMKLSSMSIGLDLSGNVLTGTIPSELGALRNLGYMDLSNNRLSGTIPPSLGSCVMLSSLYLDRNSFQGEIPDSLRALRGLEYLDLSQNNLSGVIPRFLVEFSLLYLNISFNNLQGNQNLCGGIATLNLPYCPSSPKSNKKGLGKILIPAIVGAICLALALFLCVVIIYKQRTLQNVGNPIFRLPDILRLSYGDLLNATNGFSDMNLVGVGRFGSVYKGTINDDDEQTDVAVKVLNLNVRGACKSLASECNALRGIRHRNLLKIVSVCDSIDFQGNAFKALVYEFVANRSLEDWLHSENEGRGALNAIQRLNIAIDIACAVEYLHCGSLASTEGSSSSAIKGTIGYIAPEYGVSLVASTEGDVYSYGVLVLEMFTNRRPTSDAFEGYLNLQDFVSTALTDRVMEVVDPFLHQELNVDEKYWDCIVSILRIGVRCSKQLPRDRMSMADVVNDLKKIRNLSVQYLSVVAVALVVVIELSLHYLALISQDSFSCQPPSVRLVDKHVFGTIPPFLGNLTILSQLSLSECSLQGEIPESLGQLRRLQWLNIGDNNLTGQFFLIW
ncbi:receptor kinase-like protein Xa21 [Salvia hispanica]|uniref:receptor kinase-like protein Xa21 n=1 Tax=Salvia hispanica TaxID=49212 RepID=UPI00200975E8|nr:receptor kinase-like protein Xa21 [Salvia hispanica]